MRRPLTRWACRWPLSLQYAPGEIVEFTPSIEVLFTPDIDYSLDDQRLKAAFWRCVPPSRRVVRSHPAVLIGVASVGRRERE